MDKLAMINDQIRELTEELNYHVDLNIRHEDLLDKLASQRALHHHYDQSHQRLMVVAEMYEMVLRSPSLMETHFYEQYVANITKYQNQVIRPANVELPYHKFIEKPRNRSLRQLRPVAKIQATYRHACRKMVQRIRFTPSRTEAEAHIRLEILRSRADFVAPVIPKFASQLSRLEQDVKRLEEKVRALRAKVDAREGEKMLRASVTEYQMRAAEAFNDLKEQYIRGTISRNLALVPISTQLEKAKRRLSRSISEVCPHSSCSSASSSASSSSPSSSSYNNAYRFDSPPSSNNHSVSKTDTKEEQPVQL